MSAVDLVAEVAEVVEVKLADLPSEQVALASSKAAAKTATAEGIASELKAFAAANPDTPKPPDLKLVEDAHNAGDRLRA